jgi:hypothetical protein
MPPLWSEGVSLERFLEAIAFELGWKIARRPGMTWKASPGQGGCRLPGVLPVYSKVSVAQSDRT